MLIVGAGAAGIGTAAGLRAEGFEGTIMLVGDEEHPPYDRPPLSKHVLAGAWEPERASLFSHGRLAALDLDARFGRRIDSVDLDAGIAITDLDDALPFERLVIATGLRPRRLPESNVPGVHVLRTLDEALELKAALARGVRLAIVGGGFLGLEVAATARKLGAEVTVVEPVAEPLADRIGRLAAARIVALHEDNGVHIRSGLGVRAIETTSDDEPRASGLRLADASFEPADVVLVAIGCAPNTEFLDGSGLELSDGVVCDQYCSAAPAVWAAGDVARWFHPGLGRHVRLEHRMNATEQSNAVARNIVGHPIPFAPVPFFWTDQYDVKIQVAGFIPPGVDGEMVYDEDGSFVLLFRDDAGKTTGVLGWNAAKAMLPFRRELAQ